MHDEKEVASHVASPEAKLGYALTYIQDFGGGRQVTVNFGLTVNAPKEAIDAELDKLRKVFDRQKAFMTIRDTTVRLGADRKMAAALEHMIATSKKQAEEALKALDTDSTTQRVTTAAKAQAANIAEQARSYAQNKTLELEQLLTNIAISEGVIEGATKEVET